MNGHEPNAPVGGDLAGKSAGSSAGLIQEFLQGRRDSACAARGDAFKVQYVWVSERLLGAQHDERIHAIRRTDAQDRRAGQNELAAIFGVVGKLILGVVARVKNGALTVAIDVEHIDPAMIDDAVVGGEGHLELIALVRGLICRKRRGGVGGKQGQRIIFVAGRVRRAVSQFEPAVDLGEQGRVVVQFVAGGIDGGSAADGHPVSAHRVLRGSRTAGAVRGRIGRGRSSRKFALVIPGVSRTIGGEDAGEGSS